jgi:hypothetical protein
MHPKRVTCSDCGRLRERMRKILCQQDGWIQYVCPECWKLYDYIDFFFTLPKPVN